ncbi:hypothetical protein HDE76_000694 [Rhodanobacter sp. ANJX3]|uniref:hypothetical protein n=1 Tax=Rhodanobacter sp. ANJX3 TaxID=2723083 RepID=UPI00161B9047|nr:hypothetical protein [Rhodanobacter sp. ANJX3]MBB5357512.1 hypothetical protein [Rhodanobacter sp. ANJX3]
MSHKKFNVGDRVKFIKDYSVHGAPLGSVGVVRSLGNYDCYYVELDNGTFPEPAAEHRLELVKAAKGKPSTAFKTGMKGKTEAGHKYEVLAVFPQRAKSIIADVNGTVRDYYPDGRASNLGHCGFDLIPTKSTLTTFINIYRDGYSTGHPTLHAARVAANLGVLIVGHELTVEAP